MMRALAVLLLVAGVAHAKPTAKPAPAIKAPDELTEVEALRYEVAFLREQAIEAQLIAVPELVAAKKAVGVVVDAIDAAHHLDRKAGDRFDPLTRKIERGPVSPVGKK